MFLISMSAICLPIYSQYVFDVYLVSIDIFQLSLVNATQNACQVPYYSNSTLSPWICFDSVYIHVVSTMIK